MTTPYQRPQFYIPGGLDTSVQNNQIPPEKSPDVSGFIFEEGRTKTAPGLAKVTTNALSSYEKAIGVYTWRELDATVHRLVATEHHIYEINGDGSVTSRSDSGLWIRTGWLPGMDDPIWFHRATSGSEFLCIATKAQAPMLKWDGASAQFTRFKTTFNGSDLSELWPIQSTMFYNRLIALSPAIIDVTDGTYTTNDQYVMWSKINDIENWDDGNAGGVSLVDTGGVNVGMRQMNCSLVVYQDNSIWNVHHVGGTDVFKPTCGLTDYGLWGPRLITAIGKTQYFVNSYDGNVYSYQGGAISPRPIGNDIWTSLRDDLDTGRSYPARHFMVYESLRDRLHLFVANASGDCTKAYFVDRRSGEWGVRDYSDYLTAGSTGLTGGYYDQYTERALLLCNGGSFVFSQKTANTDDDGTDIAAYRKSKVTDNSQPDIRKKWGTMALEAKSTPTGGVLVVSVFVDGGNEDTVATRSLTSSWKKYRISVNKGGHNIQTKIANSSGSVIEVRDIREPSFELIREQ